MRREELREQESILSLVTLTKWGTRSFSPVGDSLSYKEGGGPGARGPLAPPVDRPWNDIRRSACCFFVVVVVVFQTDAMQLLKQYGLKIYDSIRSKNFDCQLK